MSQNKIKIEDLIQNPLQYMDLNIKPIEIYREPWGIGWEYPTYVLQPGVFLAFFCCSSESHKTKRLYVFSF